MNKNVHNGSPSRISLSGWKKVLFNVKDEIGEDHVSIVSAGVAFYAFLAVFPAIAALVSIYGLAMDPQSLQDQLARLAGIMPQQAFDVLKSQLQQLVTTSGSTLGWSMAFGILLSLWSANKGTKSLFTGLDIAYGSKKKEGFIKENATSLLFTLGAIVLVILCMALIVIFPTVVDKLPFPGSIKSLINWGRWILIGLLVVWFLGSVYRYGPAGDPPEFKWVLPGALVATILWLLASWGFSFYVSNFGSYGEVYGSISAVVVLMLWLFLTSFIILIGAEINSEIEKYSAGKP